jgi:hypothetical protein
MRTVNDYFATAKNNWQLSWADKNFRNNLFIGITLLIIILICYPTFFQYIEQRHGVSLNDEILKKLPSYDVSVPIFIFIWSSVLLMLITSIKKPYIFLLFLIAYVQLSALRIISISVFPLEAPVGLVTLVDPLGNHFYGPSFITKDLFFSGHASTLFLIFLCQQNKFGKYYLLFAAISVGLLVLMQHIHYMIDVIFAYPFAYLCFISSKALLLRS